jgi:hypothetical protein
MAEQGRRIQVQKIPKAEPSTRSQHDKDLDTYAEICHYYSAYTMPMAKKLPGKYIKVMLRRARQLEAKKYYNLTQIAAAAQTEKMEGVDELLKHYQEQMNG